MGSRITAATSKDTKGSITKAAIFQMDVALELVRIAVEKIEAIDEIVPAVVLGDMADHADYYVEFLKTALVRMEKVQELSHKAVARVLAQADVLKKATESK